MDAAHSTPIAQLYLGCCIRNLLMAYEVLIFWYCKNRARISMVTEDLNAQISVGLNVRMLSLVPITSLFGVIVYSLTCSLICIELVSSLCGEL